MSYGPSPFQPAPPESAPPPSGHGLHPFGLGQLFSLAWRLLRYRWRAIIGAAAVFLVPLYLLETAATLVTTPVINAWVTEWTDALQRWQLELTELGPGEVPSGLPPLPPVPEGFWEAIGLSVAVGLIGIVVSFLALGAVVHAAGRTYEDAQPTAVGSAREALRRGPSLIGAMLILYLILLLIAFVGFFVGALLFAQGAGLVGFLGVLLMVSGFVALVYMMLRWYFIQQAIMLEGTSALGALGRSWRLTGGSLWRLLGYVIVLSLAVGLVGLVVFAIVDTILTGGRITSDPLTLIARSAIYGLYSIVVVPYMYVFYTLLYYDIRWRRGEPGRQAAGQPYQPYGGQSQYPYGGGQPPYGGPPPGNQPPG